MELPDVFVVFESGCDPQKYERAPRGRYDCSVYRNGEWVLEEDVAPEYARRRLGCGDVYLEAESTR